MAGRVRVELKVCYLAVVLAILLTSLEGTSAQAPGDESANCLDPNSEDYVAPLDTERFLMQSRYYNNLLGSGGVWTALDEDQDGRTWDTGFGGKCQRTVRLCHWRVSGQENWLLTQHISKDISQQSDTYGITVFVDIKWRFEACTDDSCSRNLQVHRFIANTQQLPDVSQRVATFLGSLTGNSGSSGSRTLSFTLGTSQDGFYIGIRSTGSCITIDQLTVRRQRCPPQQVGLALYPDTHAPESGQAQVDTTCVDGASADSSLRVVCESSGAWMGSPTCSCDCGYVESASSPRTCIACSGGSYRSNTDSTCQMCPDNTIDAGEGACECPCASGFYRTATEGVGTACTSPPSPLNCGFLRVSEAETTSTSITVQWQSPATTGRDDYFYTIKHTNPDEPAGNLLVYQQRYKPNTITLTGLRPVTGYRIEVSVHNGVSDQDPDSDPQRTCEVSETTTEGCPGKPSSVRSLCTAVVWGPPAQPNGVIVGYDLQFRRIGTSQISTTAKETNELFHVVEGISIPPGTEDLEFRVRAQNSVPDCLISYSDWTSLGPGCPDDPRRQNDTEPGCVILNIIVVPGGQVYWTYSRGCGDDITFTVTVVVLDGVDIVTMPEFKPEDINDVGGLVVIQIPTAKLIDSTSYDLDLTIGIKSDGASSGDQIKWSTRFTYDESAVVTGETRAASSSEDYSSDDLAVAIIVTFLLTAIIVAVFVILSALLLHKYHTRKSQSGHVTNGLYSTNRYELEKK